MEHGTLGTSIAVTALVFGLGSPELALAQGVNSMPDGAVACAAFQRSGYGSWTVLRPSIPVAYP
jgi:hypothetical protein